MTNPTNTVTARLAGRPITQPQLTRSVPGLTPPPSSPRPAGADVAVAEESPDKLDVARVGDGLTLSEAEATITQLQADNEHMQVRLLAQTATPPTLQANTRVHAMHADVDPFGMYDQFVANNAGQRMLDRLLRGDFPPEFLEGAAGQIHLMMIQDAMQARTNFMNMMSNIMKKNDEAASTVIGNMR